MSRGGDDGHGRPWKLYVVRNYPITLYEDKLYHTSMLNKNRTDTTVYLPNLGKQVIHRVDLTDPPPERALLHNDEDSDLEKALQVSRQDHAREQRDLERAMQASRLDFFKQSQTPKRQKSDSEDSQDTKRAKTSKEGGSMFGRLIDAWNSVFTDPAPREGFRRNDNPTAAEMRDYRIKEKSKDDAAEEDLLFRGKIDNQVGLQCGFHSVNNVLVGVYMDPDTEYSMQTRKNVVRHLFLLRVKAYQETDNSIIFPRDMYSPISQGSNPNMTMEQIIAAENLDQAATNRDPRFLNNMDSAMVTLLMKYYGFETIKGSEVYSSSPQAEKIEMVGLAMDTRKKCVGIIHGGVGHWQAIVPRTIRGRRYFYNLDSLRDSFADLKDLLSDLTNTEMVDERRKPIADISQHIRDLKGENGIARSIIAFFDTGERPSKDDTSDGVDSRRLHKIVQGYASVYR